MAPYLAIITDVKFFDEMNGMGVGSDATEGGKSWQELALTNDVAVRECG